MKRISQRLFETKHSYLLTLRWVSGGQELELSRTEFHNRLALARSELVNRLGAE